MSGENMRLHREYDLLDSDCGQGRSGGTYPDSDYLNPKSRDGEGLRKLTPSGDRPLSVQFAESAKSPEAEMLAVLPDVRALAG